MLSLSVSCFVSQAVVEKLALQKVVSHKLLLLKLAVAQLVGAKLSAATHVIVAKLVVAKLGLATHMGKLVMKLVVLILVEAGKTLAKLLVAHCVFLLPFAGDA